MLAEYDNMVKLFFCKYCDAVADLYPEGEDLILLSTQIQPILPLSTCKLHSKKYKSTAKEEQRGETNNLMLLGDTFVFNVPADSQKLRKQRKQFLKLAFVQKKIFKSYRKPA